VKTIILICALIFTSATLCRAADVGEWNKLEKQVRDGLIDKTDAKKRIIALHVKLVNAYAGIAKDTALVFPVKGYGPDSIGGVHGSGFKPQGYDFYDGNRHGGHPAHDIFVHDKNQDILDDTTGKPVEIVAYASGVVLATNLKWEYPSRIRSGKYIWIFSPALERYCYYVHLNAVLVTPGEVVKAGQVIGLLGRTGKNAFPKRSPTHLHFSCLSFDRGNMTPHDTYQELLHARMFQ
jgi:murein DD-endopeptidase MepM/ murein hydrolase activator NlpD